MCAIALKYGNDYGLGERGLILFEAYKKLQEETFDTARSALFNLRQTGWAVAVHNDYRLNGESFTFWLFTKGDRCVKGEGRTDAEALVLAYKAARELTP